MDMSRRSINMVVDKLRDTGHHDEEKAAAVT